VKNRVNYNRSKTRKRRKDRAFISINLIAEASPLLFKYVNNLGNRYAESGNFNKELNKGLKEIGETLGIPSLTMHCARHSFASIARNNCRFSKDDIALALNHVDNGHSVTDIYIAKDWSIVDEVQDAVIAKLYGAKKTSNVAWKKKARERFTADEPGECIIRKLVPC